MSSVKTADSLQLLSENPEIPSDLTIKVTTKERLSLLGWSVKKTNIFYLCVLSCLGVLSKGCSADLVKNKFF